MAGNSHTTNGDGNVGIHDFHKVLRDLDAAADTMAFVEDVLCAAQNVDLSQQGQSGLYHLIQVWQQAARNAHATSYRHLHHLEAEQTVSEDVLNQTRAQAYADGKRDMLEVVKAMAPDLADLATRNAEIVDHIVGGIQERLTEKPVPVLTELVDDEDAECAGIAAQG